MRVLIVAGTDVIDALQARSPFAEGKFVTNMFQSPQTDRHSLLKKLFADMEKIHPFRFPGKDTQRSWNVDCVSLFTSPGLRLPLGMFSTSKVPSSVSMNPLACDKLRALCEKFACM